MHMKVLYHHLVSHVHHLFLAPLLLVWSRLPWLATAVDPPAVVVASTLLALLAALYLMSRPRAVYLVDLCCYKPSDAHMIGRAGLVKQFERCGAFTAESVAFQRRMLERSGLGESTYMPKSLLSMPVDTCAATARDEAEGVIFGAVDGLMAKTGVKAKEIGVLVVNCSLHNPTPSYAAMIVNRYKLRGNVVGYNLGGMGCSAGLIAIDLAKNLLQAHPGTYALVVSTENMTLNGYFGNNRSMLVTNSLFRMGGAAILLSNRRSDRRRSKYQLLHTVRTHKGADDHSYSCVMQEEDADGRVGVGLSKDLMAIAGGALKANITTLGPLVLPISEQFLFLATVVARRVFKAKVKAYIPDFKLAFEHFCIHAGGRGVLDELERNLELSEWHMEPSRMTLYRFGNTSSSSLWYELAYCEAKGRIRKGDRVWQIAFGSGFKCNSAVWRSLRAVDAAKEKNPWVEEVAGFPVHVPKEMPIGS